VFEKSPHVLIVILTDAMTPVSVGGTKLPTHLVAITLNELYTDSCFGEVLENVAWKVLAFYLRHAMLSGKIYPTDSCTYPIASLHASPRLSESTSLGTAAIFSLWLSLVLMVSRPWLHRMISALKRIASAPVPKRQALGVLSTARHLGTLGEELKSAPSKEDEAKYAKVIKVGDKLYGVPALQEGTFGHDLQQQVGRRFEELVYELNGEVSLEKEN